MSFTPFRPQKTFVQNPCYSCGGYYYDPYPWRYPYRRPDAPIQSPPPLSRDPSIRKENV
jgi:hypothetical protein